MIRAYAEFGLIDTAMGMFHIMPEKNCVSRNALLAGLCENGEAFEVLDSFIGMVGEGLELTDYTVTTVAKACGLLGAGKLCEQLQGFIIEYRLLANACVEAALLDMCNHCGRTVDAGKMFKRWPFEWDSSSYAATDLPLLIQLESDINQDEELSKRALLPLLPIDPWPIPGTQLYGQCLLDMGF